MKSYHKLFAFASICLLFFFKTATLLKAQEVYTFENQAIYSLLNGQDNWVDKIGQGDAAVYLDGTVENGTHVVRPMATVIFNEPAYITRANDSAFSFQQFSGNETNALMQFDLTGDHIAVFALGFDWNNDGKLDTTAGEIGPAFGAWEQHFAILTANLDTLLQAPFGSGNGVFDWYRIQLYIDFSANEGLGSGSLYYLNLSDGDINYIPVAGLQNINLQLNNMHANAAPQSWNTMWLQLLTGGGNEPAVDNLIPSNITATAIQTVYAPEILSVLEANFPNPFNSVTTFKYYISQPSMVTINVFDSKGERIRTMGSEFAERGLHEVMIDGAEFSTGIYFYQIVTKDLVETKRMILIK